MRRLGLFAVLLSLVGLSTAVAASFDVQTEDIASFSTSTSISVPFTPRTLYLKGGSPAGALSLGAETDTRSVTTKTIVRGTVALIDEAVETQFQTWQTDASSEGIPFAGVARVYIDQQGGATPMTAALLFCGAPTPPAGPEPPPSSGCTIIAGPEEGVVGAANDQSIVTFGQVSLTLEAGEQLRLKIVNRTSDNGNWSLQWGYKENRPARLEFTAS